MEERYHATTQNRFYPDMSSINKNVTVGANLSALLHTLTLLEELITAREREDRNNRDKKGSTENFCSQQTALSTEALQSNQASCCPEGTRETSQSFINTIRNCRKLDQSNPDTTEYCNGFNLKKGMHLWKTSNPVTSHTIHFIRLSPTSLLLLCHAFQQCGETVGNSALLSEH